MKPYWIIRGGYGQDGGFGDYSQPVWDEHPLRDPDGRLVWFDRKEDAERFADTMNRREEHAFMADGEHSAYDGIFPYEYEAVEVWPPEDAPTDVKLADSMPLHGGSNWNPVERTTEAKKR